MHRSGIAAGRTVTDRGVVRPLLRLVGVLWLMALIGCSARTGAVPDRGVALERFEFRSVIMAAEAAVVLYASGEAEARGHAAAAFERMNRLDAVMSDYRVDSEVMVLAGLPHNRAHPISDDLARVLGKSLTIAEASDGAFDPTIGAYSMLWREARRLGELPDGEQLDAAGDRVGWQAVVLDSDARTVYMARPGIRLDFGGVGKGFAVDEALAVLEARGVERAMVRLGGDIAVSGAPPQSNGWRIGLPGESGDALTLEYAAVSTSGDRHQHLDADGRRYSHIIDPETGRGLVWSGTVVVVAPDATTADALATAISVLQARSSDFTPLLDRFRGVEVIVSGPGEP